MRGLKTFMIASLVLLTDFYVVHPSIRMPWIASVLLSAWYVVNRILKPSASGVTDRAIRDACIVGISFGLYMALVDWGRGAGWYELTVRISSVLLMFVTLLAFANGRRPFPVIVCFVAFAQVSFVFCFFQVMGIDKTLGDLVPHNGVIGTDRILEAMDAYGRVSGASSNTIGFAVHMSILTLSGYFGWRLNPRSRSRAINNAVIGFFGLLASQTRAALLGLIPSIVVGQMFFAGRPLRSIKRSLALILLCVTLYAGLGNLVLNHFPYLSKQIDSGDTHRLWVNYYMSVGVLRESPWIGIPPSEAWPMYLRHGDPSIYAYNPEQETPTHHNQVGFYLRYYGLIGVTFLALLYVQAFRIIQTSGNPEMRVFLSSMIILDLAFSMVHNNKLMASPILWIFLSLAVNPTLDRQSVPHLR